MMKYLKALFGKKEGNTENSTEKLKKNFELFKFDGLRAQRMNRIGYAIKCFESALKLEEDFETMGYLSQLYVNTNEYAKANPLIKRMIELEPKLASNRINLAHLCFLQCNYPAMIEAAQEAIALAPNNANAYYLLAQGWQGEKDSPKTIAALTDAIRQKPDFIDAIVMRGEEYLAIGDYENVQKDIDAVLKIDEEEEAALLLRGKLKLANGDEDGAEDDFSLVTELYPFNENAYINLGRLYIQQKRLEEAVVLLDEAVDLNPTLALAYHERGRAKLLNGNKKGADEDMKKELEINAKAYERAHGHPIEAAEQTNVLGL